jgi:hypothetical protein
VEGRGKGGREGGRDVPGPPTNLCPEKKTASFLKLGGWENKEEEEEEEEEGMRDRPSACVLPHDDDDSSPSPPTSIILPIVVGVLIPAAVTLPTAPSIPPSLPPSLSVGFMSTLI